MSESGQPVTLGTRERMIEMAIAAIERGGEAAVRVREVSDATGVSFASLYHFFGSRDGLIETALAEMYIRPIRESLVDMEAAIARCNSVDDFYDTIRAVSRAAYAPERAAFRMTRLSVLGGMAGRPNLMRRVAEAQNAANAELARLLSEPQRRGWIAADVDLITYAAWVAGLTLGRTVIELEPTNANPRVWDEFSVEVIIAAAKFGPRIADR